MRHAHVARKFAFRLQRAALRLGMSARYEHQLPNKMRLDVAIFTPMGLLFGVEIKVSDHDARYDAKWPQYLEYCQNLIFALAGGADPTSIPSHLVCFKINEMMTEKSMAAGLLEALEQAGLSPAETASAVSALRASIPQPT